VYASLVATVPGMRTIPWEWYTDPAVLRLEQERIFRSSWQYAAHTGEVPEPGSFVAARAGHVPVVVVRDHDGQLRAFVNVCRHRGYLLCEGAGRRETLQCPYHAWTYDLDGSLRTAPRAGAEPGFDRDMLGLVAVQVDTWGPFVFVNPDLEAPPLAEHLGGLPALVADGGVDVDSLEFHLRASVEYDANWKVCAENYLECYHCAVAHPSFSKAIDVAPGTYQLDEHPTFSSQYGPAKNGGGGVYDAAGEVGRGQFHYLFPNTTINVMPGRGNISIGPIVPLAAERTHRSLDYFLAPGADEAWISDYLELDTQVGKEDKVLVERVQQGMRSGMISEGALMPVSERLIAHFERLVVDALGTDA
jgi:phenylpropionate dioxygenase-like ring-hydroxylating dioxygenase large terminal subunit